MSDQTIYIVMHIALVEPTFITCLYLLENTLNMSHTQQLQTIIQILIICIDGFILPLQLIKL
jgi:hypothetical protein